MVIWIVLAVVLALVVGHIMSTYLRYRRTMRREWPKVAPLTDDDD